VRKLLTWLTGLLGIAALVRFLRQRPDETPAVGPGDPAEELRRKLAASRGDAEPAPEEPAPEPPPRVTSIEERRAEVHARAQDAIGLMREVEPGQSEGEPDGDDDNAA